MGGNVNGRRVKSHDSAVITNTAVTYVRDQKQGLLRNDCNR